jgi:ribulose-phosphate 3-epimerase
MDGQFCPELTAGVPLVAAAARVGMAVDAHVMVQEPRRLLEDLVSAGAHVVSVHLEATDHLHRTMSDLSELSSQHPGLVRGIALNPGTPVEAIEPIAHLVDLVLLLTVSPGWRGQRPELRTGSRVERVRSLGAQLGRSLLVQVDGGVTLENAAEVAAWGPDVVVSGSAVFAHGDPRSNLRHLEEDINHDLKSAPETITPSRSTSKKGIQP